MMSQRRKWMVGVVCVVLMALLAPAALAEDFIGGGPYTVDYPLSDTDYDVLVQDATVNLETGSALVDYSGMTAVNSSVVNVYDCTFTYATFLAATDDSEVNIYNASFGLYASVIVTTQGTAPLYNANVTIHGTNFKIDGVDVTEGPLPNGAILEDGKYFLPNNVVSALDENGNSFDVPVQCVEVSEGYGVFSRTYVKLGSSPSVIDVVVDIKPDSADNSINLGSMGVIPVGILSTADFDATQVDPWTVELAGAGVAVRGRGSKLLSSVKDLNGDGLMDLDVKVETENLDPGLFQDGTAVLTGQTYDGLKIQGQDSITIVPE